MAGSTRIKGNALSLTFGTPGVEYRCDTTAVVLDNEEADSDVITFCDAAEGGSRTHFLTISAIQSTDPLSLWRYIWEHTGEEVPFTYAPHGNAVATTTQPHFVGTVKIGPKPPMGGEAGTNVTYTFETRWDVVGVPTLDDGV